MVESRGAPNPSLAPLSEPVSVDGDSTHAQLAIALAPRLALAHKLGQGGMGAVWAASHPDHGAVVVKVMHAHVDQRNRERLRREGQVIARIRSPHVVRIFDWGVALDQPYLVMERLEGRDVSALLDEGPIPWREAIRITKDVLRGLAAVHEAKIVHRDIKPANIFVCRGERGAVLLDFGVAMLIQRVTGIDPLEHATRVGTTVGTPRFLSPEQACAKPVDHRADFYSLGVVMFTMLTGANLFDGRTLSSLLLAHVKEPPRPPSVLAPEVPAALDRVVLRALAKEPADRFPDARAFLAALEAVEADPHGAHVAMPQGGGTQIWQEEPAVSAAPSATQPMPRSATQPMSRQPPAIADTVLEEPSGAHRSPAIAPTAEMPIPAPTRASALAAGRTTSVAYLIIAILAVAVFVLAVLLALALTGGSS